MYNASSTHRTDIFATAAKAVTNMVPVPHLLRHYIKTVHADNAFLPQRRWKVLGGGENSPPQSNLLGADWTWCYVVMTQSHQPTTPSAETIPTESSNHELIDGMVSVLGRVGWWRYELLQRTQQKLMLLSIAGSWGENSWFGVKFQTQTSTKIPLESSDQGLFIDVIKMQWFYYYWFPNRLYLFKYFILV